MNLMKNIFTIVVGFQKRKHIYKTRSIEGIEVEWKK